MTKLIIFLLRNKYIFLAPSQMNLSIVIEELAEKARIVSLYRLQAGVTPF